MTARWALSSSLASLALVAGIVGAPPVTAATAPIVGECLEYADLESLDSPGQAVECAQSHNAEVFAVGQAPDDLGPPSQAFIPDQQRSDLCTPPGATDARTAMLDYLGLRGATIPLRTYFGLKLPTDEQWRSGDRWVRCLVAVSLQGADVLVEFESWSGSASARVAQTGAGWLLACNDGIPSSGRSEVLVACGEDRWVLVVNGVRVDGEAGDPYPGSALQQSADEACAPLVRGWQTATTPGDVIAALVTEEQWKAGGRAALCWIAFSDWNGQIDGTPTPPIPADATLSVSGPARVAVDSAQAFRIFVSSGDDTPLAGVDARVTISGSGTLPGDLGQVDVTTGGDGYADVTVVAGARGTFTVSAALIAAPSVVGSLVVTVTTAPRPEASISITGTRGTVSKKKGVIVTGRTFGLADRARVVPRYKFAGDKRFTAAKAIAVTATGTFTWRRVAPKSITVYVTSGKTTSNQITVR